MSEVNHITELERIQKLLQVDTLLVGDGQSLMEVASCLSSYNAYAGEQMSSFKKKLLEKKSFYYETFVFNAKAQGLEYFTPTLIKDYVSAKCSEEQYAYDLAERVSRSCVHAMDLLRTTISYLKSEANNLNYGNTR